MLWAAKNKNFTSLSWCCSGAIPKSRKRKDGSEYKTRSPGRVSIGPYVDSNGEEVSEEHLPVDGEGIKTRFVYKWVQHCASAMLCFICAPRIRYKRREEIEEVTKTMLEYGYSALFVTYTVPHDVSTDPKKQVSSFQEAQRYIKSGRFWEDFVKKHQYEHCITALELTDDNPDSKQKSGVHFHSHCIYFFNKEISWEEYIEIEKELKEKWLEAIQKKGIIVDNAEHVLKRGCVVEYVRPKCKTSAAKVAAYAAKAAACELSPGVLSKKGRTSERWTHWDVIAAACTTRPELQARAISIMEALKRRHWLHFSEGLKELCLIDDISDSKLLRSNAEEDVKTPNILEFSELDWRKLDRFKMQKELIDMYNRNNDVDESLLSLILYDEVHPETGEVLESARSVDAFLTLERLRKMECQQTTQ